jgi:alpha-glucosidase
MNARRPLLLVLFLALAPALARAQDAGVRRLDPPEFGFYSKRLDYEGIPVKAHAVVADAALVAGRERLQRMLTSCPTVRANLAMNGAELHIIGKDQVTSDLPEYRHLKGKPFDGRLTVDERTRGLGGLSASCGEENLLQLPVDRYRGRDICVHEFAHTVRAYGLSDDVRKKIALQYRRSLDRGLWKNAYAATNDDEFFAELSMWYFGTEGDTVNLAPKPARGREGLRKYDPDAFDLLDQIYSGKLEVAKLQLRLLPALPPEREAAVRSLRSDATATVLFVNNTADELQVYWLDGQGKRKHYAAVPAGGNYSQRTFATHGWVLTDNKGKARAVFLVPAGACRAVVEASAVPPKGPSVRGGTFRPALRAGTIAQLAAHGVERGRGPVAERPDRGHHRQRQPGHHGGVLHRRMSVLALEELDHSRFQRRTHGNPRGHLPPARVTSRRSCRADCRQC